MLKLITQFIIKPYQFNSKDERRKVIGLHVVFSVGLLYSIVNLILDFTGKSSYDCFPGFVTTFALFFAAFYCLRNARVTCAINMVYLMPIGLYFFFVSKPDAILSIQSTVQQHVLSLVAGLLFLLFFDQRPRKLALFYVVGIASITYHLIEAERIQEAASIIWQRNEYVLNPYFGFTVVFLVLLLFSWKVEFDLKELKSKVSDAEELISNNFRTFKHGLLQVKINRDATGNPTGIHTVSANHAFEALFNVKAREVKNVDAAVIFPKIFRNTFDWHNFFMFPKTNHLEIYLEHMDKWVDLYAHQLEEGSLLCVFKDITDKEKSILSLQQSRIRYKVLLEAIPDLFFIIDSDGIYVDFVMKDSESLDIKPDDIIGNSIFEVGFSENMSRKIYKCIQDSIKKDSIETIEYALDVAKGTMMFEMRIAKLDDNSVISIARDISKRKIAEINLEKAKLKAEEADQLKSAFLANISHEIRTPMNAIIGFSRMLGSSDFDMEEKNRFLDVIISNGKLLMEMINDMISISKIESKQVVVSKKFCKINDLFVELYKDYSMEVSNKPIRLKLSNENANPKFGVSTDRYLLLEIIKKLLDNAIKFTPMGEVEFGYKMISNEKLMFFVKDTGIGIASGDLERIFDRFHQIDNRTTREYEGTGLGLAIAQHYAVLLGGKIEVNSEPNKGSDFHFTIPFEKGEGTLKIVR